MSDDDKIRKDAAQRLMQGVVDFADDFAKKTGMPPAAVAVNIMSAGIGLSCKAIGAPNSVASRNH